MIRRITVAVVAVVTVSMGLVAAGAPSGGATAGETCPSMGGLAFFKPPLPAYSSPTRVRLKITTVNGGTALSRCAGRAGVGGKITLAVSSLAMMNCRSLATSGFPTAARGTATIKWLKGQPSTLTVKLTWSKKSVAPQLSGTVTAGQFKGLAASATLNFGPHTGNCVSQPWSVATLSLALHSSFVLARPVPPTTTTTTATTMPPTTSTTTSTSTTTTTTMPPTTTTEESTTTTSTP